MDITPVKTRGQHQVQLVGGLAAILEFSVSKQKKPLSHQIAALVVSYWLRGQDLLKTLQLLFGHKVIKLLRQIGCSY